MIMSYFSITDGWTLPIKAIQELHLELLLNEKFNFSPASYNLTANKKMVV